MLSNESGEPVLLEALLGLNVFTVNFTDDALVGVEVQGVTAGGIVLGGCGGLSASSIQGRARGYIVHGDASANFVVFVHGPVFGSADQVQACRKRSAKGKKKNFRR